MFYLDSFDLDWRYPFPSASHHLKELAAITKILNKETIFSERVDGEFKLRRDFLIKKNSFFEHAKIFDNLYGTLKEPVIKYLSENKDVLFDIDWQGTQQLKNEKNLR